MKRPKTPPSPREAAWRSLLDFDERQPPWEPLLRRTVRDLHGPDRGLAAELLTGVLRHRRCLDHAITAAAQREPDAIERPVLELLRLGAYQLLNLDRVPPHAAVHETVELTKRTHERAAGFVNAALRSIQRAKEQGEAAAESSLAVAHSMPDEIVSVLQTLLPEAELPAALAAMNDPGPLGLRLNPLRGDVQATRREAEELSGEQLAPHPLVPDAWTVSRAALEKLTPLLENGRLAVQDPASQLIGHLAAPKPGQRIADLCAAPGGKSAHIAALVGNDASLIATDRDKERLSDMRLNIARLGATCVETPDWGMAEMLIAEPEPDLVLIDAPCSGWGTVRHKPDLKWRTRDLAAMAERQRNLLAEAARHVRPGGALLYSVCTFLPAETDEVIARFLADHSDFKLQDAKEILPPAMHGIVTKEGSIRTYPHRHACDGFFAARLIKKS